MRLSGKVALITGGASGIGRAAAHRFAAEGAQVIVADINHGAAEVVAGEVDGQAVPVDVTSSESVRRAISAIHRDFDRLDVLVNNAGATILGSVVDLEESDWNRQLDVNLKSVYLVSKAAWPLLCNGQGASIVNTASVAGSWVIPGEDAYTASKAGVIMLTKSMAFNGARQGIRVNCVCPGPVQTAMATTSAADQGDGEATMDTWVRLCPLGRMGEPVDIANALLFLASDEAAWATGVALVIDGGWTLGFWGTFPGYP